MHGKPIEPSLLQIIEEMANDMGCTVDIASSEAMDEGYLLRMTGDGNPFETETQRNHGVGLEGEQWKSVHFSTGQQSDWNFISLCQQSQLIGADLAPECRIMAWMGKTTSEQALQKINEQYALILMEGACASVQNARHILEGAPYVHPDKQAMITNINHILRRLA